MSAALEAAASDALTTGNVLKDWSDAVIRNIEGQTDETLIELARNARELEVSAFRIRGRIGLELKGRIQRRIELQTKAETTVEKEISRLAKEIGVAPSTLKEDIGVFEVFGDDLLLDGALDREFYRRALSAPDPQAAIEFAYEAKAESNDIYSTRDFSDYVKRLNQGEDPVKVEAEKWVKVLLTTEARTALQELCERRGQDINTAVSEAIVEARAWSNPK